MIENLTSEDIQNIVSIGKTELSGLPADKDLIALYKTRNSINRLGWQTWADKAKDLSDTELIQLFTGLIVIERELKWLGGSVAGAIWIYKAIQRRQLDKDNSLADWSLRNCENTYIPFGTSYYGKRTIADYYKYHSEKAASKVIKAEQYDKVLKRVTGRKEKRAEEIAELRKLSKEARGQIRNELQLKYSTASIQERLELIAGDDKYPPEYYPAEWISIPDTEIEKLPVELIKKLYDKLSTKIKGEWKRFALALKKYDDGI
jgi:hypothetical protein